MRAYNRQEPLVFGFSQEVYIGRGCEERILFQCEIFSLSLFSFFSTVLVWSSVTGTNPATKGSLGSKGFVSTHRLQSIVEGN